MDNVQTIIDAMGGVYITVTDAEADYLNRYRIARDATTPSMDKAGTYLFTGHAAVIYMRIRKVGGDGDSGRTRRIRTVLSTLAGKYAQASLDDALQLITTVSENIVTTNMSMADLLEAAGYALELRGVEPEGIQMPRRRPCNPSRMQEWLHVRWILNTAARCSANFWKARALMWWNKGTGYLKLLKENRRNCIFCKRSPDIKRPAIS